MLSGLFNEKLAKIEKKIRIRNPTWDNWSCNFCWDYSPFGSSFLQWIHMFLALRANQIFSFVIFQRLYIDMPLTIFIMQSEKFYFCLQQIRPKNVVKFIRHIFISTSLSVLNKCQKDFLGYAFVTCSHITCLVDMLKICSFLWTSENFLWTVWKPEGAAHNYCVSIIHPRICHKMKWTPNEWTEYMISFKYSHGISSKLWNWLPFLE